MDRVTQAAASVLFASSLGCFGVTSCVARGSRIRTPNGLRRIEDLDIGDEVWSVDPETGELVVGEITAIRSAERECLELDCDHGKTLRCTSDHPLYDPENDEYADAGEWVRGDRSTLLFATGDRVERREIASCETFVGVHEVFDLTVDTEHHNFVADGILVHNKSPKPKECKVDDTTKEHYQECTCPDGTTGTVNCYTDASEGRCECPSDTGGDGGSADTRDGTGDVDDNADTTAGDGGPTDTTQSDATGPDTTGRDVRDGS